MTNEHVIDRWHGNKAWLSNNYQMDFKYAGITFPSLAHAFLASKTNDNLKRIWISNLPPAGLKNEEVFETVGLRQGWNGTTVMKDLLELKFGLTRIGVPGENMKLYKKLAGTGRAELINTNFEHDNYWGVCKCGKCEIAFDPAKNLLGFTIMLVRKKIREQITQWNKRDKCLCGITASDALCYTIGWNPFVDPFCSKCIGKVADRALSLCSDKYMVSLSTILDNIIYLPPPKDKEVTDKKIPVITDEEEDAFDIDPNFDPTYWGECGIGWAGNQISTYVKPPEPPPRLYKTKVIHCK